MARRITCEVYGPDNTTRVGELTTDLTGTRQFMEELPGIGGFGSSSLTVPLFVSDDGEMEFNAEAGWLERDNYVRFSLDGSVRHVGRVQPRRQTSVAPDGYPSLRRDVQMKGMMSEWDDAVLPGHPGAQFSQGAVRRFGWMSPEAPLTGLSGPAVGRAVYAIDKVIPEPWFDPYSRIYSTATNKYFVLDQEVETDTMFKMLVACADRITIYLNGEIVGQTELAPANAWDEAWSLLVRLPAGTHRWGFRCESLPEQPEPKWSATCWQMDSPESGRMNGGTIAWRTGYLMGEEEAPFVAAASPWGPTAAQIIEAVRAQVEAEQGLLADWVVSPVGVLPQIPEAVFDKGAKLGTGFLLKMAQSWCDLSYSTVGKTLYVFPWRERGNFATSPSLSSLPVFCDDRFAPVSGRKANVRQLSHEERVA